MLSPLSRWLVKRQLKAVSNRLKAVELELRELSAQRGSLSDDYADAEGVALLGGRIEAREAHEAHRHLDKATSRVSELAAQIEHLRARQDQLLDRLGS